MAVQSSVLSKVALIVPRPFLYDESPWAVWTAETNSSPRSNCALLFDGASIGSCFSPPFSPNNNKYSALLVLGAALQLILLSICSFSESVTILRRGPLKYLGVMNDRWSYAALALCLARSEIPPSAREDKSLSNNVLYWCLLYCDVWDLCGTLNKMVALHCAEFASKSKNNSPSHSINHLTWEWSFRCWNVSTFQCPIDLISCRLW